MTAPARPTPPPVDLEGIPRELRRRPQWVAWRYELDDDGEAWTKIPKNPRTQGNAMSNQAGTWADFDQAILAKSARSLDGVSFALTTADPYVGVDLDHCFDPASGAVADWAATIVAELASYTERTPSGAGLRVWCRGTLPPGWRKQGDLEMYLTGRFLTVTGWHLAGTPTTIEERSSALAAVHARHAPPPRPAPPRREQDGDRSPPLGDSDLLRLAFAARNGPEIAALYNGDWSGHTSQSEADAALCRLLAFYTQDRAQLDRLFAQSGLARPKWTRRTDYRERTLDLALSGVGEVYRGPAPRPGPITVLDGRTNGAGTLVPAAERPRLLTRADLDGLPDPTWLVAGLVETGSLVSIYGPTNVGKTFVALDLALALATGQPWWGREVRRGPVVYVVTEGAKGLKRRIHAWEAARHAGAPVADIYFWTHPINLFYQAEALEIVAQLLTSLVEPLQPALIVFDTLSDSILGADENSNADMRLIMHTAKQVRDVTGATVLITHHTPKSGDGMRGSTVAPGALDTMLELRDDDEVLTLTAKKQREGEKGEAWRFVLAPMGESRVLALAAGGMGRAGSRLTPAQRAVLEALASTVLHGGSLGELRAATGLPEMTLYRALIATAAAGYITIDGPPKSPHRRYFVTDAGRALLPPEEPIREIDFGSPGQTTNTPTPTESGSVGGLSVPGETDMLNPGSVSVSVSLTDTNTLPQTNMVIAGSVSPSGEEGSAIGVCPACGAILALDPRAATAGCPYCGAVPDPTGTLLPLAGPRTCRRCTLTGYPEEWLQGPGYIFHSLCPPPEPEGEGP